MGGDSMSDDGDCIHGLGPVACCTICNGRDRREADQRQWRYFMAKYAGQCLGCDLPIHEGQMIAWPVGGGPVYHEGCEA